VNLTMFIKLCVCVCVCRNGTVSKMHQIMCNGDEARSYQYQGIFHRRESLRESIHVNIFSQYR
jgi:hypothetical protein